MIYKSIIATLAIVISVVLVSCGLNETAFRRIVDVPEELELNNFKSKKDRSAMHGPSYISFDSTLDQANKLHAANSLLEIKNFPDQLPERSRRWAVSMMDYPELAYWPSIEEIRKKSVFTNAGIIESSSGENLNIIFSVHVDGTLYMVVISDRF